MDVDDERWQTHELQEFELMHSTICIHWEEEEEESLSDSVMEAWSASVIWRVSDQERDCLRQNQRFSDAD